MLTVTDVKLAVAFYQRGFRFVNRGIMNGPDGKAVDAELRLRDTTLMLGPDAGGCPWRENGRRFGDEFVPADGECGQGSRQGG